MFTRWWTENSSPSGHKREKQDRKTVQPFHQRKLWRAGTAVVLSVALLTTAGCGLLPKEEEEEVLPAITPPKLSKKPEYPVKQDKLELMVRGSGRLMATQEETLFFTEENKRVKEVYAKAGDYVEKGKLLVELDVTDLESQLRQKRLQARSDELAMIEKLRKADEISAEELERSKIDFELKKEDVRKLEETVAKAKLTAPFSGTVASMYVQKGDQVKAYDTVAIVADMSQLTVAAELSTEDAKKVAVGMEAIVDINGIGKLDGKVKQLPNPDKKNTNNNRFDPWGYPLPQQQNNKDSIENYLIIELNEFPQNANRGTPLSVSVITQRKEGVMLIPLSALRTISGRNYVQVVDNDGSKREVDVEVGQQTATEVEIVRGLTPGQKVVGR
jgi:membrane fusion protein, macrolide-specific efflux system